MEWSAIEILAADIDVPAFSIWLPDVLMLPAVISRVAAGTFGLYLETAGIESNPAATDIEALSKALIFLGCRSFWFNGPHAEVWEDAADNACVAVDELIAAESHVVPRDLYEARFTSATVMTTTIGGEKLIDTLEMDDILPPLGPLMTRFYVTVDRILWEAARAKLSA